MYVYFVEDLLADNLAIVKSGGPQCLVEELTKWSNARLKGKKSSELTSPLVTITLFLDPNHIQLQL